MIKRILIPIYDDKLEIVGNVESSKFEDNFTTIDHPPYMNCNARVCLLRLDNSYGRYWDTPCIIYYYEDNPMLSYAELLTESEAYNMCLHRGRLDLAEKLNLKFVKNVEVTED